MHMALPLDNFKIYIVKLGLDLCMHENVWVTQFLKCIWTHKDHLLTLSNVMPYDGIK